MTITNFTFYFISFCLLQKRPSFIFIFRTVTYNKKLLYYFISLSQTPNSPIHLKGHRFIWLYCPEFRSAFVISQTRLSFLYIAIFIFHLASFSLRLHLVLVQYHSSKIQVFCLYCLPTSLVLLNTRVCLPVHMVSLLSICVEIESL